MSNTTDRDYTTGSPRRHHSLYIEEADFVIQVENAIFKVHRLFLSKDSNVLRDMLNVPQTGGSKEGTEESPLVLTGDNVSSWESLLSAHYDSPCFNSANHTERMLSILPLAHKYCMVKIEQDIIEELKTIKSTDGHVDLMVAAKMVNSDVLYKEALRRLTSSQARLTLDQAQRVGLEAYFEINEAVVLGLETRLSYANTTITTARIALEKADNTKCQRCTLPISWRCTVCQHIQTKQ